MKYYTKEWYALMQTMHYTGGLKRIPDGPYSDAEIRAFYEKDLAAEIANDRRIHNTPPSFDWAEDLLDPERFQPEFFLLEAEDGTLFQPETPEIAREYLERDFRRQRAQFESRPPFDPAETVACFRDCYRRMVRYGGKQYPEWVQKTVDPRLLALCRMPESAYKRLRKEERTSRRSFERIMAEAETVLSGQDIPPEIRSLFCFHDADVLRLKRKRGDLVMILRTWNTDEPLYTEVTFRSVSRVEREPGFSLRLRPHPNGGVTSGCQYLYDELYRVENGYEIHMMLTSRTDLRYLTVTCEDVAVEEIAAF